MSFPLDKILSISVKDFCDYRSSLAEYEIKGVNFVGYVSPRGENKPMEKFAALVPEGTEIVIAFEDDSRYNDDFGVDLYRAKGLALVPKNK